MAKESAEEKLLKMMQKSSSVSVKSPSSLSSKKKLKLSFSINALNAILLLAIVVLLFAFIVEMHSGFALLNQGVTFPTETANHVSLSDVALPALPTADFYLQKINERNIFKPYVVKTAKKAAAQGLAQRLLSRYKLVGIAWLDLPETASVMIEDTQKHTTLFLKQGGQLDDVTVKTIYTDRVVFSHENEETTIKL